MAKPRDVPDLRCDETFAGAAARVVGVRADELLEHVEGVLEFEDIERLHAMRVASRRLRAAMEIFEPCFPRRRFKAALKDVKAIADALGERRDRDVSIEALGSFSRSLGDAAARGVPAMVERLRDEQTQANRNLAPYVDRPRLFELRGRIRELEAAAERLAQA